MPGARGGNSYGNRPWHTDKSIIRRARSEFARLDTSQVRTVDDLIDVVSVARGKPIYVREVNDPDLDVTAVWIQFSNRSSIILRQKDRQYYKARGLFHELGHIIFQHPKCVSLGYDPRIAKYAFPDGEVRGRVLIAEANLPALYGGDRHESEAEALATIIGRKLLRPTFELDDAVFG